MAEQKKSAKSDEMRKAERVEARVRRLEQRVDQLVLELRGALNLALEEEEEGE